MPCYSPLNAFKAKSKTSDKMAIVFRRPDSWRGERLDLPCGQCVGCRLERARQWAVRCMHEASLHEDNSFLTLTYDDKHLPVGKTLVLSDFQNFMKRLRRSIAPKRVRFYHCGEYGEPTIENGWIARPHYHALLFGHDFTDRTFFSKRGEFPVYTSRSLSNLWPLGFSVVGQVSFDSANYVARYVMKKLTGDRKVEYGDRKPEYSTMSRRPGIGRGWYDLYRGDVYPVDRVVVNGKETRPPKFYDRLFEKDDRSAFEQIKIDREIDAEKGRFHRTVDGRIDEQAGYRLRVKEEVKKAQVAQLIRPLEGAI